ncbi:MAG: TonB family protein [Acidobacteriota bacterium]
MEALVHPPQQSGQDPELVFEFPSLAAAPIGRKAWVGSLLVHVLGLIVFLMLPHGVLTRPAGSRPLRAGVHLVAPPSFMTQTAPNRGKVGKEVSLENLLPRPPVRVPAAIPPMSRQPRPMEPPPAPKAAPAPRMLPEPPQVEMSKSLPPGAPLPGAGGTTLPAQPQLQTEEKPKLAFETPGAAPSGPPRPRGLSQPMGAPTSSVMEAARDSIRGGHGGTVVGDSDLQASPGILGGLIQVPTPGKTATALELMSDPQGVDFKPYLIRILAVVKRNWLAVIPESARLGRAGRVQIQFAIARDGYVPKLVIALPSGTDALDRAAVAGVSASTPFPPLPAEFKGNQVRLQFTFSYNIK